MNLLVFNCGSSSQGFTVYRKTASGEPEIAASGKARGVATKTLSGGSLTWTIGTETGSRAADFPTHRSAAVLILDVLRLHNLRIDAIGHRFVNGGTYFDRAAYLDDEALARLRECLPLAPIHNPNSYSVIEVCREMLPGVPQYAVFDTAFHSGMAPEVTTYAIPKEDAEANGWRKIGFHGLSYQYVSGRAASLLGKPLDEVKLIMCHLGTGGSSVCAFRDGKSYDTSMGWSTNGGLVMSTRSGDIDQAIVLELIRKGMMPDEVSDYLNKKSGLIGLSGYSSNPGEIIEAARAGNADCALAFAVYINRLRGYIGNFLFRMNGADALIFTDDGGVRYPEIREAACADAELFGLQIDTEKNRHYSGSGESCISTPESRIQIWVIPTDEERTIYNEIMRML